MTIEFRTAPRAAIAGLMLACGVAMAGSALAQASDAAPVAPALTATGKDATRAPTAVGAVASSAGDAVLFYSGQSAEQWMASKLIGATVVGADDKAVGAVTDLMLGQGGGAEGVVIGVGGFLGVGEKKVAVPFAKLEVVRGEDGKVDKIRLALSRDELEKAPTFFTLAEKKSREKADQPARQAK